MSQSFSYNSTNSYSQTKRDQVMTNEQFEQIVEAILAGKYSWACVLILRFAGYNPLHYIPYRTYNRLIKDNCLKEKSPEAYLNRNQKDNFEQSEELPSVSLHPLVSHKSTRKIDDLKYLEELDRQETKIMGGGAIGNLDEVYPSPVNTRNLPRNFG